MRGAGPQHGEALIAAIQRVAGVACTIDAIPVHGMLDQDILHAMMLREGMSEGRIAAAMPEIVHHAQECYPDRCPDLRTKVLPGVRETLERVAARRHPMAVVTGNLTRIGWTKLERAGLREFFSWGAFAEMAATRGDLARMACTLARASPETKVTLIGDSPSDVAAARANGFRCVAVATGMTPREDLEALGPDLTLNDLARPEDQERLIQG